MINIILLVITSFLVIIFAIPSIITVAKLIGLYDKPEERKIHTLKIPRLGGLAIFISFALSVLVWADFSEIDGIQYIEAAMVLLFFSGLKDDIIILSPWKKLMTQIVAAGLVTSLTQIRITDFYGIFGIHEISLWISIPLSIFTIIVITNSFNLIDGVDGLAGSLGLVMSLTFAFCFYVNGNLSWSMMAFALSGSLMGFLFFNINPAKIFMGDAGSLTVGFLLAIFAIFFIESNSPFYPISNLKITSAPGIAIAILVVPLYDTLRVFIVRATKKRSPFKADKNHLHHWLIKIGMSHKQVSLCLTGVNILFILIAFAIKDNPAYLVLVIICALALVVGQLPVYFYRHKISDLEADDNLQEEIENSLRLKSFKD